MACFFNADGTFVLRRGDTAEFTIESEDIPFEEYDNAYFAVINLETLQPVLPELTVPTSATRSVTFTFTAEQTEQAPQPEEPYAVYGYTFKLCTGAGVEDTFIPEVTTSPCGNNIIVKKIPKVYFYPKVIEGVIPVDSEYEVISDTDGNVVVSNSNVAVSDDGNGNVTVLGGETDNG